VLHLLGGHEQRPAVARAREDTHHGTGVRDVCCRRDHARGPTRPFGFGVGSFKSLAACLKITEFVLVILFLRRINEEMAIA